MTELLVVGEALVDVVSSSGGKEEHPGGSPMNVAIGLARLGASVTLATRVGTDARGVLIARHLTDSGVRLAPGSVDAAIRTSSATATIGADGSATYDFDIGWDVTELPTAGFELVHTGSIGALLAPGADAVAACFDAVDDGVLRSFDPNIRPSVLGGHNDVLPLVERLARSSTVVKMSDEDARWLHPELDPLAVTAHYARLGAQVVVVTLGAEGSLLRVGGDTVVVPSHSVRVADTIGAGDSFMAGLLFALTNSIGVAHVMGRTAAFGDILQAARFAAACAAITVSRPGADLPRQHEVVVSPQLGTERGTR
ncbi:carbohydrate kinase [Agreia sp. PsM10]|uniref:carbohydrate kinase family protein n=1 Tax=Agreia sp. PsM10 TaxID=3030533 RepID=UPI00263AE278|nr:carbohydrate kinase [Agreia sp. PsM10]MDN4640030.1 carbohydrate kinase [Agreia sp. PsM10]